MLLGSPKDLNEERPPAKEAGNAKVKILRIGKFLCHAATDVLYRKALGMDVVFFHVLRKPWAPEDWRYQAINPVRCESPRDIQGSFDYFIVDDHDTLEHLIASKIAYRKLLWHCHGLYHKDAGMRDYLTRRLKGLPTIFPSCAKQLSVGAWIKPSASVVLGVASTSEGFSFSNLRNGRAIVIGNDMKAKMSIYMDARPVTISLWQRVATQLRGYIDVAGFNGDIAELGVSLGYINEVWSLAPYQAGLFMGGNESPGFSMVELMAAGVPCVMYPPKEGFDEEWDGKAYLLCNTPELFVNAAKALLHDEGLACQIGKAGQDYVRSRFYEDGWSAKLRMWKSVV